MPVRRVIPIACGAALLASLAVAPSSAIAQSHHHHASHAHHHAHVNLREYRANVRRWHDPSDAAPAARTPEGRLVLRLYSLNTHARAEITPGAGEGAARFDDAACAQVATVLMDSRTQAEHSIDPLLVEMLYRVADHFAAPEVRIVSGYRAGSGHSNHALGRAVDFIIPGATDRAVADYAQSLGDVGVGFYPVSGFVHLDVRDRPTTWVDASGPGSRARYVQSGRHRHGHHHHHGPTARR
jgi:uncharacterized protein YcbK (DUF882 family)